jgi:hypothetical protein
MEQEPYFEINTFENNTQLGENKVEKETNDEQK